MQQQGDGKTITLWKKPFVIRTGINDINNMAVTIFLWLHCAIKDYILYCQGLNTQINPHLHTTMKTVCVMLAIRVL